MLVRLFGGVRVAAGEDWVRAGPAKQQTVLAVLAMSANEPVPLNTLARDLWGAEPPSSPQSSIYGHIAKLRRLLRSAPDATIQRAGSDGYRLDADTDLIDVHRMRRLARIARGHAESGEHPEAVAAWRAADGLVRGDALAGIDGQWARTVRATLRDEHLSALTGLYQSELESGRHAAVLDELSALVARHPVAEPLVESLMLALYRSGRAAEALERFTALRERLNSELGMDPSQRLRTLQHRILNQDASLLCADAAATHTERTDTGRRPVPAQLPTGTPAFTGRDRELAELAAAARTHRVLTIDGMAGVGKTALAVHLAHRLRGDHPDGQLFLDLHGFSGEVALVTSSEALGRMLRAFGVPQDDIPAGTEDRAAALRTTVAGLRVLFVLDNAADEAQLLPLLPGGAGVIVTSRRRLPGVDDSYPLSLDVLDDAAAVRLFREVSGRTTEPESEVLRLVRCCGGLPLAVRIAAARLRHRRGWSVADATARLSDRARVLSELTAGQRGVAASLDLSYEDLSPRLRRLFRLLSVFPGGELDGYTAGALADAPAAEVEPELEELVDAHLLGTPAAGRYRFHDLVRQYAVGRTEADPGEPSEAFARVVDGSVRALARARLLLRDSTLPETAEPATPVRFDIPGFADLAAAAAWFHDQRANLLAVLAAVAERGDDRGYLELANSCVPYLHRYQHIVDELTVGEAAVAAARRLGETAALADWTSAMIRTLWHVARLDEAEQQAREALRLYRDLGDELGQAIALNRLGTTLNGLGDNSGAVEAYEAAIRLADAVGDADKEAMARCNAVSSYMYLGRLDEAETHARSAIRIFQRLGNDRGLAHARLELGELLTMRGHPTEALEPVRQSLDYGLRSGEPVLISTARDELGKVFMVLGRYDEARAELDESLRLVDRSASRIGQCTTRVTLGELQLRIGEVAEARQTFQRMLDIAAAAGFGRETAQAHHGLGDVLTAEGDREAARVHYRSAHELYLRIGAPEAEALREQFDGVTAD